VLTHSRLSKLHKIRRIGGILNIPIIVKVDVVVVIISCMEWKEEIINVSDSPVVGSSESLEDTLGIVPVEYASWRKGDIGIMRVEGYSVTMKPSPPRGDLSINTQIHISKNVYLIMILPFQYELNKNGR
jgi:hypothetical protein